MFGAEYDDFHGSSWSGCCLRNAHGTQVAPIAAARAAALHSIAVSAWRATKLIGASVAFRQPGERGRGRRRDDPVYKEQEAEGCDEAVRPIIQAPMK
jgi:hypothetical protein